MAIGARAVSELRGLFTLWPPIGVPIQRMAIEDHRDEEADDGERIRRCPPPPASWLQRAAARVGHHGARSRQEGVAGAGGDADTR